MGEDWPLLGGPTWRRMMTTGIRGIGALLALVALAAAAPGYAVAGPPVPTDAEVQACNAGTGPCAFLYETTENLTLKGLKRPSADDVGGRRKATSALLGFAVRGTPLCPEELFGELDAPYCAVNATGSSNIDLKTGLGQFNGTMTIVVQESNAAGMPTPDSPEKVIARGHFSGKMDFAQAILQGIPLGTVSAKMKLDGLTKEMPFTGVFRLPFLFPPVGGDTPLYLLDPKTFQVEPVAGNEMAIGFPTVRFEISFP